ncbi:MAG TPA: hypothetical protein VEB22_09455 [Phycisphaerales bacterium]|nr:hypothetical protein [Phycisphaerales bacterium]
MSYIHSPNPPTYPAQLPVSEPAWPKVLGIVSIVLGSLGAAYNACSAVGGLLGGSMMSWLADMANSGARNAQSARQSAEMKQMLDAMQPWMIAAGVVAVVSLAVSVWLLVAGITLVKRRAAGFGMHKGWAWTRIAMGLVTAGVTVGMQKAQFGAMNSLQAAGGGPPSAAITLMLVGQGLFAIALASAYPVVVLAMMTRRRVSLVLDRWGR